MAPHNLKVGDKIVVNRGKQTGVVTHVDETIWVGVKLRRPLPKMLNQYQSYMYDSLTREGL